LPGQMMTPDKDFCRGVMSTGKNPSRPVAHPFEG